MDNQDQHPVNDAPPAAQPAGASAPVNSARRRFARAGLGASGVILTLASQPGMAATRVCKSASGSLSGGLQSRPTDQNLVCGGMTPSFWLDYTVNAWPGGTYPVATPTKAATLFSSVFPGGSGIYATATLLQMLGDNAAAGDTSNLGTHLVTTYLNIMSDKISYITIDSLKLMWHDLITYGFYTPQAGTQWTAEQVKIYLESTEG